MPAGVRATATLEGQGSATRMHDGHGGSVRRNRPSLRRLEILGAGANNVLG
jgi:hypothetical protein